MNKVYARINWENYPSDATPVNEINLNKIDGAADELDNRIIVLDASKFDKTEAAKLVKGIEFDRATGVFTITQYNGATMVIDTMLEKLAVNFDYDPVTQKLVITLDDGTIKYIDLSALITQYEFLDSDTVAFSVDAAGKVTAIVKEGSIEEKHLRPNYLADIKVEAAKAQASATAAAVSETNAKTSEANAAASAESALTNASSAAQMAAAAVNAADTAAENAAASAASKESAEAAETNAAASAVTAGDYAAEAGSSAASALIGAETAEQKAADASASASAAEESALEAESYAHGGTGTREGEDADNAKEYARQAAASAKEAADIAGESFIPSSEKGVSGGVATLDSAGKVPESQLPDMAGGVTGVKGDAETAYRAGNVNLTAADIGLGNVANERQYSESNPQPSVTGSSGSCTGNAATATKWAAARNINGMSVDGSAARANYGTCSTAAATAAKVVACAGFALATGAEITVKFTVTNTAASPTLNVNSTGAKAVYYRGAAISAGALAANRTYTFRYNGTQYELVGDIDTNTIYGAASATANGLMTTGAQTFAGAKTFNGAVKCAGASDVATAQARNIYAGTEDMIAGTTELATGAIYLQYE